MGPDKLVVTLSTFDEELGFFQRVEDLPIEELVAQPRMEALDVAVFPGRARRDESRAGPDRGNPLPDGLGNELGVDVGSDLVRNPA